MNELVLGARELSDALLRLPAEMEKKAVWSALLGAGQVVVKDARSKVPILKGPAPNRRPGTVKRAIRAQRSKITKGQNGRFEVIVRVRPLKAKQVRAYKLKSGKGGAQNPDDPFYWWWLEFGTSKMPARPFLRPAFESTKEAQLAAIRDRMRKFLEKQAAIIKREVDSARK